MLFSTCLPLLCTECVSRRFHSPYHYICCSVSAVMKPSTCFLGAQKTEPFIDNIPVPSTFALYLNRSLSQGDSQVYCLCFSFFSLSMVKKLRRSLHLLVVRGLKNPDATVSSHFSSLLWPAVNVVQACFKKVLLHVLLKLASEAIALSFQSHTSKMPRVFSSKLQRNVYKDLIMIHSFE